MHSLRRWSFLLGTGLFSLVSGAVVPMPPGITPAPQHLQVRQESPDAVDFVRVLITALPQSLREVAVTNVPAVSRMLWEEFLDDNRPQWFRDLPVEIQSYLINVFGPATTAPSESYTIPTEIPASVTSQPTETSTARPTFASQLTSDAADSSTSTRATPTSTRAPFTFPFPFPTRSTLTPSASSPASSLSPLPSPSPSASSLSSSAPSSSSQIPKSSSTTLISTSAPSSAPPSSTPTDPIAPPPSNTGLTRNEKLAIGLGVPLGTLSIAALLLGCFLWWRRRKRQIEGSQPPSSPGFIPRFSFADADGYTERLNPGAMQQQQHGFGDGNWDDTDDHDVDTAYYHGIPPVAATTQMGMLHDGHRPKLAPGLYHSHSSNRARGRQISGASLHSVAEMREPDDDNDEPGADSPVLGRYYQHTKRRGLAPRQKSSTGRTLVRGPGGFEVYAWSGDDVGRTPYGVPCRPAPVPLHATAPQYSGTGSSSSSGLAGSSLSSQSQSPYAYVDDYVPEYYYTGGAYDGPYDEAHIGRGY